MSTTADYATALDREAIVNQENVMVPFKHCVSAFAGYCLAAVSLAATQATLTLGENTSGIAVDGSVRKAFVSNFASGTISVIDLDTRTVKTTINVRTGVRRPQVSSALNRLYVVSDTTPGYITVIDTKTETIIADVQVGNRALAISADFQGGALYVRNFGSNSISVFDTATNTVTATIALAGVGARLKVPRSAR